MRRRVAVVAFSIVTSAASEPLSLRVLPQAHPGPVDFRLASVSGDGRFVAFVSEASLLPGDTNGTSDIYVFEMNSGRLELASVSDAGAASSGSSSHPHLSRDGRFLVFDSVADNLAADAPSSCPTVYLRDRSAGTTRAIVRSSANPARVVCGSRPVVSGDGRVVAFESHATDLVDGIDANGNGADVYVVDTQAARTSRISVDKTGRQDAVGSSYGSSISVDGRYVAFTSTACLDRNLAGRRRHAPAERCPAQVYARDRFAAVTRPVMAMNEAWPNGPTHSAALSADGRYVTFGSTATNLVPGPPTRTGRCISMISQEARMSSSVIHRMGGPATPRAPGRRSAGEVDSSSFSPSLPIWSVAAGVQTRIAITTSSPTYSCWTAERASSAVSAAVPQGNPGGRRASAPHWTRPGAWSPFRHAIL